MASFTKRGKTWQYTVSNKGKPIRKGGFRTKKEAQIAAADVETELTKGLVPNFENMSLANYFYEWIKVYKNDIASNTKERYLNTYETLLDYFGDKPIQDIKKRTYQSFLNDYAKDKYKSTVRKLNTHVRACVQEAIEEGIIRVDFTRGAVFPGHESKREEEKHLNYNDSQRLMKELYNRLDGSLMNHLLLLGLTSGMRYGELVGLTRKDFNFKNNTINISQTWGYTKKMHKGFGPTKNESSIRIIDMNPETMMAFKNLFKNTPDNIHRLVFYSQQSKYKVLANGSANKALEAILNHLEIGTITAHGLRHTHASILLYKKISINYVADRLGHSSTDTTQRHYSHLLEELREQDRKTTVDIFQSMLV